MAEITIPGINTQKMRMNTIVGHKQVDLSRYRGESILVTISKGLSFISDTRRTRQKGCMEKKDIFSASDTLIPYPGGAGVDMGTTVLKTSNEPLKRLDLHFAQRGQLSNFPKTL